MSDHLLFRDIIDHMSDRLLFRGIMDTIVMVTVVMVAINIVTMGFMELITPGVRTGIVIDHDQDSDLDFT